MAQDPSLGINITKVGILASAFPIAYSFSKLVAGVLGDRLQPSKMLAYGLLATAITNVMIGAGNGISWFVACWILNGLLQGIGAPACARLMTSWYSPKEKGFMWGIWTTSNNMGGALSPIIAGTAAMAYGWRYGMFAPAAIAVLIAGMTLYLIQDNPAAAGYPAVHVAGDRAETATTKSATEEGEQLTTETAAEKAEMAAEKAAAAQYVFRSPQLWAMAIAYFFVYAVRQGASAWFMLYLLQGKGLTDAALAAMYVSALEIGGLCGSLTSGRISDYLIDNAKEGEGTVGKRVQVMMAYSVALVGALAVFQNAPIAIGWMQWWSVFGVGFCLYGPQMLMGLAGSEIAGPQAVGASQGLLGWISYIGAASAGVPLSIMVNQYGWSSFFTTLSVCAVAITLCLAPLWNLPSRTQKEAWATKRNQ